MANTVIHIATESRSEAAAFAALFDVLNKTERGKAIVWDFSQTELESIHPFFRMALAVYLRHCGREIVISSKEDDVWHDFGFNHVIWFDNRQPPTAILSERHCLCKNMPLCAFPVLGYDNDALQTALQKTVKEQLNINERLYPAISYLLGEMCCNISEHAHSEVGYIAINYCEEENALAIMVADVGISIFSSYVHAARYMETIAGDEVIALKMATEGYSTKNLPDTENRGYGLSSSSRIVVEGLHGSFYLLSGNAFFKHGGNTPPIYVGLPPNIEWPGTAVFMQIPLETDRAFSLMNYV